MLCKCNTDFSPVSPYRYGTVNDTFYPFLESGECRSLETEALAVTYVPLSVPEPEQSQPAGDFHQILFFLVSQSK
jgi:hypothetical protein